MVAMRGRVERQETMFSLKTRSSGSPRTTRSGGSSRSPIARWSASPPSSTRCTRTRVATRSRPRPGMSLALDLIITQNGIPLPDKVQVAIGARWNGVVPFALTRDDPNDVYIDPGPPPQLGGLDDAGYKEGGRQLVQFSSWLDTSDGVLVDRSPGAFGNNPLGTNDGTGHPVNPATGLPYEPNVVLRGDWGRVLTEFWADGPDSETPPGHWNVLANEVSDHPDVEHRIGGDGAGAAPPRRGS